MATFTLNNILYTAVYIDMFAGTNGDGSSPMNPLNTLPDLPSLAPNTALIFRRSSTPAQLLFSDVQIIPSNNLAFFGSPVSTDTSYNIIPFASYWGSDAATHFYATVNFSSGYIYNGIWTFTGVNQYFENINFIGKNNINYITFNCIIETQNPLTQFIVNKCNFNVEMANYDTADSYGNNNQCNGINLVASYVYITNSSFDLPGYSANFQGNNLTECYLINCNFKNWCGNYASTQRSININSSAAACTVQMYGCNLFNKGSSIRNIYGSSLLNYQCGGAQGSKIDMLNCNFTQEKMYGYFPGGISFYNISYSNFTNCNITINDYTFTNPSTYLSTNQGSHNFKSCTFLTSLELAYPIFQMTYGQGGYSSFNYINCNFNADAIYGSLYSTQSVGTNILNNCNFIKGNICVEQPTYIPSIIAPKNGPSVSCYNSGILCIDTLHLADTPLANRSINLSQSAKVLINNLDLFIGNGPNYNYLNFNGSEQASFYCSNEGGIQGNWSARSYSSQMIVSNSYRTGGSNFSIKCNSHRSAVGNPYIWMAPQPFDGIPITIGTPGDHTLTIYYAHKGYDPSNPLGFSDLQTQIQIPVDSNGNYTYITNRTNGQVLDDTSTWNLDIGLSVQKMVISFNLPVAGIIYVRVGFFKYQPSYPNGYLLIDPAFVVG